MHPDAVTMVMLFNLPHTDDLLLQQELVEMMPHVNEANAMSEELKKKIRFEIVLISPQSQGLSHGRTEVWGMPVGENFNVKAIGIGR